jgi:hypothetical protein
VLVIKGSHSIIDPDTIQALTEFENLMGPSIWLNTVAVVTNLDPNVAKD